MQLLEDQQVTTNAAATCIARTHNGTRPCKRLAAAGSELCSYHADVTPEPPQESNAAPEPAPMYIGPEAVLMALESKLARLRDERDQADQDAAQALARANIASRELITSYRERMALQHQLSRQQAA